MNRKSYSYLALLFVLLGSFFVFTGGVRNSNDYFEAPTINTLKVDGTDLSTLSGNFSGSIFTSYTFEADATGGIVTSESGNCIIEETSTPVSVSGELIITRNDTVIVDVSNIQSSTPGTQTSAVFSQSVSFNQAGTYVGKWIVGSTSPNMSTDKSFTFTITNGSFAPIALGKYALTSVSATCTSSGTYTSSDPLVLNNSALTISSGTELSFHSNIVLGSTVTARYTCLKNEYKFDMNGKYSVVKSGANTYTFTVNYKDNASVPFVCTYTATTINLAGYDPDGNQFAYVFTKTLPI